MLQFVLGIATIPVVKRADAVAARASSAAQPARLDRTPALPLEKDDQQDDDEDQKKNSTSDVHLRPPFAMNGCPVPARRRAQSSALACLEWGERVGVSIFGNSAEGISSRYL